MDGIDRKPGIRPRPSIGRRLDLIARACFPAGCTAALLLLSGLPFGIVDQAALLPAFALCGVWFWSLYRPAAMPPPVVFLLGVLADLLGYMPVGVGVLTLMIAHAAAFRVRRGLTKQGFAVNWLAFAPVAIFGAALPWLLASALRVALLPSGPAALQAALSIALYPALGMAFIRANQTVADPNRA